MSCCGTVSFYVVLSAGKEQNIHFRIIPFKLFQVLNEATLKPQKATREPDLTQ